MPYIVLVFYKDEGVEAAVGMPEKSA